MSPMPTRRARVATPTWDAEAVGSPSERVQRMRQKFALRHRAADTVRFLPRAGRRRRRLAQKCWAKLSFHRAAVSARGSAFPLSTIRGRICCRWRAIANPPAYQRGPAPAVRYDEVARTLVHALKYQDRTDLAPRDGAAGWHGAGRETAQLTPTCWCRFPLHWRRGWSPALQNQSGALAAGDRAAKAR